jgi:hypothetical protein
MTVLSDALTGTINLWKSVRSNPVFVAVSSAMVGAVVSAVQDEMASGKIDFTRGGINKLTGYAVTAAIAALVHLYRPNPPSKPEVKP